MSEQQPDDRKMSETQIHHRHSVRQYHEDTYFRNTSSRTDAQLSEPHLVGQEMSRRAPLPSTPSMSSINGSRGLSTHATAGSDVSMSRSLPRSSLPRSDLQSGGLVNPTESSFETLTSFTGGSAFNPWQAPIGQPVSGRAYPATPRPVTNTGTKVDLGPPPSPHSWSNPSPSRSPSGPPAPHGRRPAQNALADDPDAVAYYLQQEAQRLRQKQRDQPH